MEKKLIPAPLDEKNVTTDWIESVFDYYDYTYDGKNTYTGFVKGSVCCCVYHGNHIIWHINQHYSVNAKQSYEELIKRLHEFDTAPLVVKYDTSMREELFLMQKFYWEDE